MARRRMGTNEVSEYEKQRDIWSVVYRLALHVIQIASGNNLTKKKMF